MAKTTSYNNVTVEVNDRNDSFVPDKPVRSVTVKYNSVTNSFTLTTPAPQERRDPVPPVYEVKDLGMQVNKLAKGYKVVWDVNIKAAKIATAKKVKAALGECVDAMFKEIETNNL